MTDKIMKLKELTIRKGQSYQNEDPNRYVAEIEWVGQGGSIKTALDHDISDALLGFIGPAITKFSHQAALEIEKNLTLAYEDTKHLPPVPVEAQ